jgi:hypothetical protein
MDGSYYEALCVPTSATPEQIKKAYRDLARQWHPDLHIDPVGKAAAHERFCEIGEAYAVLSDPESRRAYDARLLTGSVDPCGQGERVREAAVAGRAHSERSATMTFEEFQRLLDEVLQVGGILAYLAVFGTLYGAYRATVSATNFTVKVATHSETKAVARSSLLVLAMLAFFLASTWLLGGVTLLLSHSLFSSIQGVGDLTCTMGLLVPIVYVLAGFIIRRDPQQGYATVIGVLFVTALIVLALWAALGVLAVVIGFFAPKEAPTRSDALRYIVVATPSLILLAVSFLLLPREHSA